MRLIDSCITQLRLQDPLGPVTRVKKKKKLPRQEQKDATTGCEPRTHVLRRITTRRSPICEHMAVSRWRT